jgi:hypothetical protein
MSLLLLRTLYAVMAFAFAQAATAASAHTHGDLVRSHQQRLESIHDGFVPKKGVAVSRVRPLVQAEADVLRCPDCGELVEYVSQKGTTYRRANTSSCCCRRRGSPPRGSIRKTGGGSSSSPTSTTSS